MNPKKNSIYIHPLGGLSNRILAINSAYFLAKELDRELVIIWEKNSELGCWYEDVFEKIDDFRFIYLNSMDKIKSRLSHYRINRIKKSCDVVFGYEEMKDYSPVNMKFRENEIGKIIGRAIFIEHCSQFYEIPSFDAFVWNHRIREASKVMTDQLGGSNQYVAVHIRRTDHAYAIKNSPLELFEEKIGEILNENHSIKIFLATDDYEVEKQLKFKFGEAIIAKENKVFKRTSKQGIIDACIDILCLSEAKYIIGSTESSFSVLASRLKNRELIIVSIS